MRKAGQHDWADKIEAKIRDNDFVVSHGLVNKKTLMKHFRKQPYGYILMTLLKPTALQQLKLCVVAPGR